MVCESDHRLYLFRSIRSILNGAAVRFPSAAAPWNDYSMKICHLTTVHRPFDTRIFQKEARCLACEGFEVAVVAPHTCCETVDGVTIVPLPPPKGRLERMTVTVFRLLKAAFAVKADVYHFHDPELIPAGLILKLMTRAAVFYDVHEDYPKLILQKAWLGSGMVRQMVSSSFRLFERVSANFFDQIVTVTDDIAAKFPLEKTTIARNYVSLEVIDRIVPAPLEKKGVSVIYMGNLERNRGIVEIVDAAAHYAGKAELWLLGKWESEALKADAERSAGWANTRYFGYKSPEEAFAILKSADIGLHCVYPNDYYLKGLPTKLFEYASCGIPAVMTHSALWEKMFGAFVLFADPKRPEDIAEKITRLADDEPLRKSMGCNAREYSENTCNWEREGKTLVETYRRVNTCR